MTKQTMIYVWSINLWCGVFEVALHTLDVFHVAFLCVFHVLFWSLLLCIIPAGRAFHKPRHRNWRLRLVEGLLLNYLQTHSLLFSKPTISTNHLINFPVTYRHLSCFSTPSLLPLPLALQYQFHSSNFYPPSPSCAFPISIFEFPITLFPPSLLPHQISPVPSFLLQSASTAPPSSNTGHRSCTRETQVCCFSFSDERKFPHHTPARRPVPSSPPLALPYLSSPFPLPPSTPFVPSNSLDLFRPLPDSHSCPFTMPLS